MSHEFHSEDYRGHKIRILQDEDCPCPLNDDGTTLCRIAHWHRGYRIGAGRGENIRDRMDTWITEYTGKGFIVLPLAMMDHSGVSYWIGSRGSPSDPGGWDSGQVGYVWCTWQDARGMLGGPLKTLRERAVKRMTNEIKLYNWWQEGTCAGWTVASLEDEDEELASCWGFLPDLETGKFDYAIMEARAAIDDIMGNPTLHNQPGEH